MSVDHAKQFKEDRPRQSLRENVGQHVNACDVYALKALLSNMITCKEAGTHDMFSLLKRHRIQRQINSTFRIQIYSGRSVPENEDAINRGLLEPPVS